MITANQSVRILPIGDPGPTQEQIVAALGNQNEFQLLRPIAHLERLIKEIHAAEADLIVIGHLVGGQPTLDLIDDIVMQFPEVPVVAVLPDSDPLRAQQVTLAGARAFITEPFTQVNLISTLRRVRDLEARRVKSQVRLAPGAAEEARPMRTFAVYSPRGGVGVSTLALNLAVEVHQETQARVLLVDGKLMFGHLDLMLNIRSRNSIADLVPHAAVLAAGLIGDVVVEHASGIHVLAVERLEKKEIEARVQACIRTLEPDQREVLILRDIQGFSYEEIGGLLKLADGTVKSRLFRARAALKDCLVNVLGDWP